jgi:hypothetical protein
MKIVKLLLLKKTFFIGTSVHLHICTLLILLSTLVAFNSCGVYSFTGASISPDVKTFTVNYFENNSPLVNPNLSQVFTEALKEKVLVSTSLNLIKQNGDVEFEGQIVDYKTQPISITGNEIASQNRLTISVKVKFTNTKDETKNFETSFTRYADYNSTQNLTEVETNLVKQINTELVEDIFNKAFVNW